MKTINHETYCSQDLIALLLRAGFDWKDYFVAHSIDERFNWEIPLHVAQRWLREVKQCYVQACPMFSFGWTLEYYFVEVVYAYPHSIKQNEFKTYEEAQEAGIKKALEVILEKEE